MGCCDKKRAAIVPTGQLSPRMSREAERTWIPAAAGQRSQVTVRYTGAQRIQVRGTATGTVYHCSASSRILSVDVRDVPALLRTGLFTGMPRSR
jgi:hypothetical protein